MPRTEEIRQIINQHHQHGQHGRYGILQHGCGNRCLAKECFCLIVFHKAAGVVARLEQKKLVEGFGNAEDRRIKMVRITPLGEQCLIVFHKNPSIFVLFQ